MMRVTVALLAVLVAASAALAAPAVTYEAKWDSLDKRPTPAWFHEAKFGIFIHWGVYSVPSWGERGKYAEWYWNSMQDKKGPTWKFHERVYGKDFPYFDFAPMFRAELFNPDEWADVFARSGAKYIVLTSKHHEGFCLWPNADASRTWGRPWNSVEIGPKRDLLGDLTQAVRAKGLKMGLYYSLYEWYNPLYKWDFAKFRDEHYFPQFKDVVNRYKPSIIFADGEWEKTSADWKSEALLAWLFNEGPNPDEVVVNDRWGKETRGKHGGYWTTEYGGFTDAKVGADHPWEESRGMGASYGFNRNESIDQYNSDATLIRLLADTVGRGGNLLLDIGPTADGRIPVVMQERLIQIGQWLKVNGEAVYGSEAGPFALPKDAKWACTVKPGKVYVHVFARPADGKLLLPGLKSKVKRAWMLANKVEVATEAAGGGVTLTLPEVLPDARATVVAIEIDGKPEVAK